jgi:hypothetical protein
MLTQKMPRHPTLSVSTPAEHRAERDGQAENTTPDADGPGTLARVGEGVGDDRHGHRFIIEPPTACSMRNTTSQPRPGARLHSREPRVKVASPIWKIRRRPSRSAVDPARMRKLAMTTV